MDRGVVSPGVLELLRQVDSPTLSTAIEYHNVRDRLAGFAGPRVRCLFPELGVTVGYAVTAQVDRTSPRPPSKCSPLPDLIALIERSPKPVVLVFQDVGRRGYAAAFGYYGAAFTKRVGAVALVCDTSVKDLAQVRGLGFQFFAAGSVVSHGHPRIVRMNVPVVVDGMYVEPGDLIHGDLNGVLSVPLEIADKVASEAMRLRHLEDEAVGFINGPEFTVEEAWKKRLAY